MPAWTNYGNFPHTDRVLTEESTNKAGVPIRPFTKREREILDHLVQGMTSKEIGAALGLSSRSVDHRVADLCDKAGVWRRTELVAFAVRGELRAA